MQDVGNAILGTIRRLKISAKGSFDFSTAFKEAAIWLVESAIEGFIANFALHEIFGVRMTVLTVVAYGFLIKEAVEITQRLLRGPTSTVSEPPVERP